MPPESAASTPPQPPFVIMTSIVIGTFAFFGAHTILWLARSARLYLRDPRAFRAAKIKAAKDEETFVRFKPFDRLVEPDEKMRGQVVALTRRALARGRRVYILVNNKAEGSSPLTVLALARRLATRDD